jgi:hypothetical protein
MNRILNITTKQRWDPFPDLSYLEQPGFEDRLQQFRNDEFSFVGISAEAEIVVNGVCQMITSGGLWGIESDSDQTYLDEIAQEELAELKVILESIGFTPEAVAQALR